MVQARTFWILLTSLKLQPTQLLSAPLTGQNTSLTKKFTKLCEETILTSSQQTTRFLERQSSISTARSLLKWKNFHNFLRKRKLSQSSLLNIICNSTSTTTLWIERTKAIRQSNNLHCNNKTSLREKARLTWKDPLTLKDQEPMKPCTLTFHL